MTFCSTDHRNWAPCRYKLLRFLNVLIWLAKNSESVFTASQMFSPKKGRGHEVPRLVALMYTLISIVCCHCTVRGVFALCCWLTSSSVHNINPALQHSRMKASLVLCCLGQRSMGKCISMCDCSLCETLHGVLAWGNGTFFLCTLKCWTLLLPLELPLVSTPLYVCLCAFSPHSLLLPHPYTCSFSRLFSSSGPAAKRPASESPVNVKYNAPTSQIQPSVKKRSTNLQQLPSDKSKAFDFLNEE